MGIAIRQSKAKFNAHQIALPEPGEAALAHLPAGETTSVSILLGAVTGLGSITCVLTGQMPIWPDDLKHKEQPGLVSLPSEGQEARAQVPAPDS